MAKRRTRFITWAKRDPNDATPINYTFYAKSMDGSTYVKRFTSADTCSFSFMERLRNAWIESITKVNTENGEVWEAVLYED